MAPQGDVSLKPPLPVPIAIDIRLSLCTIHVILETICRPERIWLICRLLDLIVKSFSSLATLNLNGNI